MVVSNLHVHRRIHRSLAHTQFAEMIGKLIVANNLYRNIRVVIV